MYTLSFCGPWASGLWPQRLTERMKAPFFSACVVGREVGWGYFSSPKSFRYLPHPGPGSMASDSTASDKHTARVADILSCWAGGSHPKGWEEAVGVGWVALWGAGIFVGAGEMRCGD